MAKCAVKAWAVLTPKRDRDGQADALRPYGNGGNQFQFPIFHARKEARSWRDEDSQGRGRIVRVSVERLNA
jgi:hypothetical protein